MSYVAGRVAIVPKGAFSASTQYDRLDMVSYNGSAYVSKTRPPVGTLPTNTQYWALSIDMASKADAEDFDELKDRVDVIEPSVEKITPLPTAQTPYTSQKFNYVSSCPIPTQMANRNVNLVSYGDYGIFVAKGKEISHTDNYAIEWISEELPLAESDSILDVTESNEGVVVITKSGKMYVRVFEYPNFSWVETQSHFENGRISGYCYNYSNLKYYVNESIEEDGEYVLYTLISDSLLDLSSADVAEFTLTFSTPIYSSKMRYYNGYFIYTARNAGLALNQNIYLLDANFDDYLDYFDATREVEWINHIRDMEFVCGLGNSIIRISVNNDAMTHEVVGMYQNPSRPATNSAIGKKYFVSQNSLYMIDSLFAEEAQVIDNSKNWTFVVGSIMYESNVVAFANSSVYVMQNGCDYVLRAYDDGTYEWVKVVN